MSDNATPWEPPLAGTEVEHLVGALERMRTTFRWKADDLDAAGLQARIGTSALTIGGLLIATVLSGLRFRRGDGGRRELLDGLTVAAGAGLTAWIVLANPAIDAGMHPALAVLGTAYLPITVMLLTFAAELMLEGLLRNRAMWLVTVAFLATLAGGCVRAMVQSGSLQPGWHSTSTALLVVAVVLLLRRRRTKAAR